MTSDAAGARSPTSAGSATSEPRRTAEEAGAALESLDEPRRTSSATSTPRAAEAAEYLEHLQRLQAEFDNYRKRVLREQTRRSSCAAEPVMRRLLEVLDDFELALMAASDKPDFERFLQGVELVYAKLARRPEGRGAGADRRRGQAVRSRACTRR